MGTDAVYISKPFQASPKKYCQTVSTLSKPPEVGTNGNADCEYMCSKVGKRRMWKLPVSI